MNITWGGNKVKVTGQTQVIASRGGVPVDSIVFFFKQKTAYEITR